MDKESPFLVLNIDIIEIEQVGGWIMDLGQVFTSKVIAGFMASQFNLDKSARILEPCFGSGAFLEACQNQGYSSLEGCEIDDELFYVVKEKYPEYKLFCRDFLSFEPSEKYEGIIMNPPYVRQEKIDDLEELGISKGHLRKNPIYNGLPSTANLYMYCLIKAIDLLKENGQLIVIFPSSWMQARSGSGFKKLLFLNTTLTDEIYVSGDVFEKNALVDVVILKLIKSKQKKVVKKTICMELTDGKLVERHQENAEMTLALDVPFDTYSKVRRGLTTGWNTMFINPSIPGNKRGKYIKKIISTPKAVVGYNTNSALTDELLMISTGENLDVEIGDYIHSFETILEKNKKPKTLYEKVRHTKEWYTLNSVDSDGILFSYFVRNEMKFVMNTTNVIARDNFYIIYPGIDKYLMFALLNNYYTYYQLELIGKKYGAGLLKLQRYDIENLKFIDVDKISDEDHKLLISLSKDLVDNSNQSNIEKITRIISKYVGIDTQNIIQAYEEIKRKRLEAS